MAGESGKLKHVGIELGAGAFGSASAAFTHGLCCTSFNCNPKTSVEPIPEVRGKLSTVRVTRNAAIDYDAALVFPLDVGDLASGNIGHFLQSILGTDIIGGSGPYQHKFTRADTSEPTWFNLYSDKDATEKQYAGFRANSVKFTLTSGEGQIPVEVGGIVQGESALGGAQSLVFSASPILTPQQATTLTIASSPITNFESIEITIARTNERFRAVGSSRLINNQYTRDFRIDIALSGINFASETERDKFKASPGTASAFNMILTDSASNYLHFYFPELYYTLFDGPDINDTELLKISVSQIVTGDAYYVELQNNRSTAYSV